MKKGEFDLTGKAIDCSGLPALGDAGKEIFRALKAACSEGEYAYGFLEVGAHPFMRYAHNLKQRKVSGFTSHGLDQLVLPIDVLGQAAIDAAMDGATILFEGDFTPASEYGIKVYYSSGSTIEWREGLAESLVLGNKDEGVNIVAYKLLEEKQSSFEYRAQPDALNFMNIKITDSAKALADAVNKAFPPSIDSRILAEKVGFKELCPSCSPKEWQEREAESYDDLRDAHLDLVRESMEKDKEIELLKQRIKDMHRAMNDAKAALDA